MENHMPQDPHPPYSTAPPSPTDGTPPNGVVPFSAAAFSSGSSAASRSGVPPPRISPYSSTPINLQQQRPLPSHSSSSMNILPTRPRAAPPSTPSMAGSALGSSVAVPRGVRAAASPSSAGISRHARPTTTFSRRRAAKYPAFAEKLRQMALPLAPLVQLTTGDVHPAFPRTLLNFWLLTEDELESLATFYHQRTPNQWARHYPSPVRGWESTLSLEEKRRKMGKFIGLRGCETPAHLVRQAELAISGWRMTGNATGDRSESRSFSSPHSSAIGGGAAGAEDDDEDVDMMDIDDMDYESDSDGRTLVGSDQISHLNETPATPPSADEILRMARTQARRGEDDDEIWRRKLGWY